MKIYTKTGDNGLTSLFSGERVSKSDERVDLYGTIDELDCYVGLISAENTDDDVKKKLNIIQNKLFIICSLLANTQKNEILESKISSSDIKFIEDWIDEMDKELDTLNKFIVPTGNKIVAFTHITRTICRKAERKLVKFSQDNYVYTNIIVYINRLSDLFFTLARYFAKKNNIKEIFFDNV